MTKAEHLLRELQEGGLYKSFHFTVLGSMDEPEKSHIRIRAWDGEGQVSWTTTNVFASHYDFNKDFEKLSQAQAAFKKFMREALAAWKAKIVQASEQGLASSDQIYKDALAESPKEDKPNE